VKPSDLFVKCLENQGVTRIFGVPGEENTDFMILLEDSEQIEFELARHEQGAAFMAEVHGRLTGEPGLCLDTLGPGATNLITGVADSNMDRAPRVVLTGRRCDQTAKGVMGRAGGGGGETPLLAERSPCYLGNEAVVPNADLEVTNKFTGDVAMRVPLADAAMIDRAIDLAVVAEQPMREMPAYARQAVLMHCVNRFEERFEELAGGLRIEAARER
jgi:hypothetical protein